MKNKVFLCAGTPFNLEQKQIFENVQSVFSSEGLTLCQPEFSSKAPILNVRDTLDECVGLVAIAGVRYTVYDGVEKPGGSSEASLGGVSFATPWIHIETALAYEQGIPIMVIADKNLKREGFLEHAHDWSVQYVNFEIDFFKSVAFRSLVQQFDKQIEQYKKGKFSRFASKMSSKKTSIGALISEMSVSGFLQVVALLITLLSGAFALGTYVK